MRSHSQSSSVRRHCRPVPQRRVCVAQEPELSPEEAQARLLERIAMGAKICHEVEEQLRGQPVPELETIIHLHRVLVLKLSAEAQETPALLQLANTLMKPLLSWARLEENRKARQLAEEKYRDEQAARKAAEEKMVRSPGQGLRPKTREEIERELHLF